MTLFRTILITMAAAATLSLGAIGPASAGPRDRECLTQPQIEAAIASGQIQSWARIRKLASVPEAYREASDIQVCTRNGALYFVVSLVSPKGEYFKIVLNAVDGSS